MNEYRKAMLLIDKMPIAKQCELFVKRCEELCDDFCCLIALGNALCSAGQAEVLSDEQGQEVSACYAKLLKVMGPIFKELDSRGLMSKVSENNNETLS